MTASPAVRDARAEDASAIVWVMRHALPREMVPRTIYACSGASSYIQGTIDAFPLAASRFAVATVADQMVGAAEFATNGSDTFLSMIATIASERSRGVGTSVLRAVAEAGREMGAATMTLDVLETNVKARHWYNRLGFAPIESRGWWEVALTEEPAAGGTVSGLPQADLCHRAFGFSEVVLQVNGAAHRVGRLGSRWFRVTDPGMMLVRDVRSTLTALDRTRVALVSGTADVSTVQHLGPPAASAVRMRAELADVLHRLGAAVQQP